MGVQIYFVASCWLKIGFGVSNVFFANVHSKKWFLTIRRTDNKKYFTEK